MDLRVVTARLYYAPEDSLLQMESLEILLQGAASVYPSDILVLNEYLL